MVEAGANPTVSMEERMLIPMPEPSTETYIPESILEMQLEDKDIFLRTTKGEFQRICFANLELTPQEADHWRNFIAFCEENQLTIPERYLTYEGLVLRYLQATRFDYQKAHAAIMTHNKWSLDESPHIPPSQRAMELINMGFMYLHKRDRRGRCIVICDVPKIADFLG